ncbi:MAG: hypothetical protein AB1442_01310 [Nitrospirota bacterium]
MFKRIRDSFEDGLYKMKWFSTAISDRVKIELSVLKLLYQAEQMERKKEELMKTIGKRMLDLKDQSERTVLNDRVISETMSEVEKINRDIEETKKKASEISSTG